MYIHNKNKKKVQRYHKDKIKELFYSGAGPTVIANTFGYNMNAVVKYLNCNTFRKRIINGKIYYICSICKTPKLESAYYKIKTGLRGDCIYCHNLVRRNKTTIQKNLGEETCNAKHGKKAWDKNGWKYNIRKRLLRIIGVIDGHGRRIDKKS